MWSSTYFKTRRTSLSFFFFCDKNLLWSFCLIYGWIYIIFTKWFFDLRVPILWFKGASLFHLQSIWSSLHFWDRSDKITSVCACDCPVICDSLFYKSIHKPFGKTCTIFQDNDLQKSIDNTTVLEKYQAKEKLDGK